MYLNSIFSALADPTRRDILWQLMSAPLSVGQIAEKYPMSFAAVSLHLKVLEKAKLITKTRRGKQHIVTLSPVAFKDMSAYLKQYDSLWQDRFNQLHKLVEGQNDK